MATAASIRELVRNNIFSAYPAERPFLEPSPGFTDVATTFAVNDGTNYSRGDIIDNQETGEQLYVSSVSTNTLTVIRGWNGTTAAASTANDRLATNPRITVQDIDAKVTSIIRDLHTHGVYKVEKQDITLDQGTYIYSLEMGDLAEPPGIIAVYYKDPAYGTPVAIPYMLQKPLDTAIVASGEGIRITPGSWNAAVATGHVLFATKFADATELTTDVEEAVVLGATGRLIGRMIGPMLQDPGQYANRTVPQGQPARDARWYQGEYLTTVRRLAADLAAKDYGIGSIRTNRAARWRR